MAEINAVVTYDPPWSAFSTTLTSIPSQLTEAFNSQAIELLQHVVPHAHRPSLEKQSLPHLQPFPPFPHNKCSSCTERIRPQ